MGIAESGEKGRQRKALVTECGTERPTRTRKFASEGEAKEAADAKAADLKRSTGQLSLTLIGDPTIRAEAPLKVSGLYPVANGKWTIQKAKHAIKSEGFITSVDADKREDRET